MKIKPENKKAVFLFTILLLFQLGSCKNRDSTQSTLYRHNKPLIKNKPVLVIHSGEGKTYTITPRLLKGLHLYSFKTGLGDRQRGYLLKDIFYRIGITSAVKIKIFSRGARPYQFDWKDVIDSKKGIMLSQTHRNTFKIISSNKKVLPRDKWLKHCYKILVFTGK